MTTSSSNIVETFILGAGYIGGSLLQSLLLSTSPKYQIRVLVRNPVQAEELEKLGVKALLGDLSSLDKIRTATAESDLIINTSSADDIPSVQAILEGLNTPSTRPGAPSRILLHTSGTGLLVSDFTGSIPASKIYSDLDPASIDALPETAPHRDVDLLIKTAVEENKVQGARIAIIIPPVIYGLGNGPFNKISIALPMIVKRSIETKQGGVPGTGVASWNSIHIATLITAYERILSHVSAQTSIPAQDLYWFAETGDFTWLSFSEAISEALFKRGLVDTAEVEKGQPPSIGGTNARCTADRLKELGWATKETISIWESVDSEVEAFLKK